MANETKIGQLVIDLQIKTKALEQGVETAKKKIEQIEKSNEQVKSSNKGLEASYIAMATVAVASLIKIKSALDDGVAEYTKYKNSMMTVNKVAQNTGTTLSEVQDIINKSNEFKLMNEADLNAAIKNLLLYGYTAEQATDILKRLQDSAVGNRQECYSLSEAVRVTTEGIRMENSVTSDAAGVQKNIAKMYEEYAEKLGKKTDALTQAEKAQAVYNGIMEETAPIVGSAAEIAGQYEGAEAQKNAELLKTKQLLGESLIPTYTELSKIQKNVLSGLNGMLKNNKAMTAGIITLATTLLGAVVATKTAQKAVTSFSTATGIANTTTKTLTASLMANPLFWGGLAISVGLTALNAFNTAMQESINKTEESTQKAKETVELLQSFKENDFSYTETEAVQAKNVIDETEQIMSAYKERKDKVEEIQRQIQENTQKYNNGEIFEFQYKGNLNRLNSELYNATEELKKYSEQNKIAEEDVNRYTKRIETLNKTLQINTDKQNYANLTNVKATRQKLIDIAQTQADIDGKKKLLNILKQGKTSTDEYADAKSQLVKVYPELARVNENTIASTEASITAEEKAAQSEWDLAQSTIQNSITELQAMKNNDAIVQNIAIATKQKVDDVKASIDEATTSLVQLSTLAMGALASSNAITSGFKPKVSKSSKTYQNKALDNCKKQIEYKKSLDQISLQQEISMYETALRKYAKTQDEKMELTTKVYELKKQLQQEELDNDSALIDYLVAMDKISKQEQIGKYEWELKYLAKTTDQKRDLEVKIYELRKELNEEIAQQIKDEADKEREILNRKTEDYKRYIQDQKNLRGAEYDVKEQEADLNEIIKMHRNYLNQIMKDERYSLDERESIYREELDIIRDYEQQKRDARVSSVNNTVSQLKSAITKQIEEMQEADEKAIKKNIELVEEWKNTRIEAINAEYNARIEAIQKELDALDKAEQQKSRDEEDAEYEKKKKRLEELAEYEHDATTKANYLKELAKLEEEYQKTVDKRLLEDKKEALKEQQDLLKEEQTSKTDTIKEEAEKQKEQYETQLDDLKEYYDKQKEMAQETAEKMLLNVEQNQNQILSLLNKYGDKYEITGQSLGEKLAQGINNGLANKIQGIIQTIQDRIDGAIENQISKWTSAAYQYEQATSKAQTKTVQTNVTQNNYIQQNPEMPSETYRKLNNVSRNLAAELAGV